MSEKKIYTLSIQKVYQGFAELREQALLCDVVLVAEDVTFPVHRVILAAASPYFNAMFTSGFKENQMDTITMEGISARGLEVALNAIYSSEISLTEEAVEDILLTASILQLDDVLKACESFILDNVAEDNCVFFMLLCKKYDICTSVQFIDHYILDNFEAVSKTDDFANIPEQYLCKYLASDQLRVSNGEIEVFRTAVLWVEKNLAADKAGVAQAVDVANVIRHVRFPLIPPDVLIDEVLEAPVVDEHKSCRDLVKEGLRFHSHPLTQPLQAGLQFRPRGDQKLVVVQCGTRRSGYVVQENETQLHILDISDGAEAVVQNGVLSIPTSFAFRSMSVVSKGNFLFLFATDNASFSSIALRYDVTKNKCMDLKSPPCGATIGAAAAHCQDEIYLLGGMTVQKDSGSLDPRFFNSRTLRYSIATNTWDEVCESPQAMTYHAATNHGHFVYVAGGYVGLGDADTTPSVYAFDVRDNVWLGKADMCHSRYQFCLETVNDSIYACGGRSRDYSTGETSIEVYNVLLDQWTILEKAILEHCVSSDTFSLDNKLFIVGGRQKDPEGKWVDSDLVSCVDVDDDSLCRVLRLPFPTARHVCALLTVPR